MIYFLFFAFSTFFILYSKLPLGFAYYIIVTCVYPYGLFDNYIDLPVLFAFLLFVKYLIDHDYKLHGQKIFIYLFSIYLVYILNDIIGLILYNDQIITNTSIGIWVKSNVLYSILLIIPYLGFVISHKYENGFNTIIKSLVIGLLFLSIIGLLQYFIESVNYVFSKGWDLENLITTSRISGNTSGPWALGGLAVLNILICFALLINSNKSLIKYFLFICIAISTVTLILTGSRTSWIMGIVGFAYLLAKSKFKNLLYAIPFILVIVYIIMNSGFVYERLIHRVNYTYDGTDFDTSTLARIEIWGEYINSWTIESIITGMGRFTITKQIGHTPHNNYIAMLTYHGIIGLTLLLYVFSKLHNYTLKRRLDRSVFQKYNDLYVAILLGLVFYGFSADTFYTSELMQIVGVIFMSIIGRRHG